MEETDSVSGKFVQQDSSMFIGEGQTLNEVSPTNIPGFKQTTNFTPQYSKLATQHKQKKTISKFFSNFARWGMDVEDDIIKNMRAIPADKNLIPKDQQAINAELFSGNNWKVKSNQDKNFFEKDFTSKRDVLRKLALQPELEDILDTMANEAVVYDSNYTYFLEPFIDQQEIRNLNKDVRSKIEDKMSTEFSRLYKLLNWKTRGWDDFKRFLVEGELAWEIVFDSLEKPTKIIGLVPVDVATLTKKFDNGKWYWIQYKGIQGKERRLLDSQIVYIQYQETNCINRVSYLERLIRPFNLYRIVEQAQIIWTITNAQYKMKFTIPVNGMSKVQGMQTLNSTMNKYKENIKFQQDTAELTINGQTNFPFNKEYWLPSNEAGTPEIDVMGGEGPELNDNDQLKFFKNQLYKVSKIPLDRFDQESGATWFGTDATSISRAEMSFARFVDRLRNTFCQVILKPLQLQLALDIPELQGYKDILDSIQMQFKSYNVFEELMEMELMQKRVEFIQMMKDSLSDYDQTGNEVKFFSSEFLVKKYLHMSDADLKLNNKYREKDIEDKHLAGDPDVDPMVAMGYKPDPNADPASQMGMGESLDNLGKSINEKIIDLRATKAKSKKKVVLPVDKKKEEE